MRIKPKGRPHARIRKGPLRNGVRTILRANYKGSKSAWREETKAIKKRDGNRCVKCGRHRSGLKEGEYLETHHIKKVRAGGAERRRDLITICSKCHDRKHIHLHKTRSRVKPKG